MTRIELVIFPLIQQNRRGTLKDACTSRFPQGGHDTRFRHTGISPPQKISLPKAEPHTWKNGRGNTETQQTKTEDGIFPHGLPIHDPRMTSGVLK